MAEEKKKSSKIDSKNTTGGASHPFIGGCIIGLILGIFLGWWFRPPSSFPIDELKKATEEKFGGAKDHAREDLADFAENLARKLRKSK